MARRIDWDEVLESRYATFKMEESAFAESLKIANSTDVAAEKIYEAIKSHDDIPENLKLMYHEFLFGTNKNVKKRIKNRLSNIRRSHKQNPDMCECDTLHAKDYSNMTFNQLKNQLESNKKRDASISKAVQDMADQKKKMMEEEKEKNEQLSWQKKVKKAQDSMHICTYPGFSKPSCIALEKKTRPFSNVDADDKDDKKKMKQDDNVEEEVNKDLKLHLDSDEYVFSDKDDSDEQTEWKDCNDDNDWHIGDEEKTTKKYNRESGKKLISDAPKPGSSKSAAKKNLKRKLSAEEQFDRIVKKRSDKCDLDLSLSSDEDIKDLLESFTGTGKPKRSIVEQQEAILADIKKATAAVSSNAIEHTALIRGTAVQNDIDLKKYKDQVKKELNEATSSTAADPQPENLDTTDNTVTATSQQNPPLYQNQLADPENMWKYIFDESCNEGSDNELPDIPEV